MKRNALTRPSKKQLKALRRHDRKAVSQWFLEHADQLYAFALARAGNDPELAADVVQDTFLAALDKLDDYDSERGAMIIWLMYIARNCLRTRFRKSARYTTQDLRSEEVEHRLIASVPDLAAAPIAEEILEQRETAELVQLVLAGLTENHRWALTEHYFNDTPLKDLASSRSMSVSAVKSLLFRARQSFREGFESLAGELAGNQQQGQEVPS